MDILAGAEHLTDNNIIQPGYIEFGNLSPAITEMSMSATIFTTIAHNLYPEASGENGNLDEDPQFVDLSSADYHLLSDSPCIDSGDPESALDPDGTIADIGALYFHQEVNALQNITVQRISVYPNPVSSRLQIPEGLANLTGRIICVDGQQYSFPPSENGIYDVRDLINGVYMLLMQGEDGSRYVGTFVKQ